MYVYITRRRPRSFTVMHLTTNVLLVSNALKKRNEEYIYNTYLKNYSVIQGVMCCNGDCLAVVVLDRAQLLGVNVEILETLEYTSENVEFLSEKICIIAHNYNKYYQNK
ncbi:hypothetical protein [Thysanoplusia orichalcea nucleopolyhedrovirus]|uniref:Uncharacterized protein n=1 Tax=Thysanoplusia orichalcea nucleopolyhedrovirus TaxID=101850 RepID=L0CK41_9ABAC|nr:hypothetical protein [Thysanoplusia orichalcea nucleopolyhedrovirus]AGA16267.1 hypothetical protein [Thysanoplusia orichalcea nucleopolyhedrovirus]